MCWVGAFILVLKCMYEKNSTIVCQLVSVQIKKSVKGQLLKDSPLTQQHNELDNKVAAV